MCGNVSVSGLVLVFSLVLEISPLQKSTTLAAKAFAAAISEKQAPQHWWCVPAQARPSTPPPPRPLSTVPDEVDLDQLVVRRSNYWV